MIQTTTENIWNDLYQNKDHSSGVIMRRHSASSMADAYVSMRLPEKIKGIAFKFHETKEIDTEFFEGLKDIKVEIIQLERRSVLTLVLSLINNELESIFAVLAEDLFENVSTLSSEDKILGLLKERFNKWKTLFTKARDDGLSPEAQAGLFGELYLLKRFISNESNGFEFVDYWQGPEDGIRDFEKNSWAVEVKTSRSHNPQRIYINSERQLDTNLIDNLFLYHLSLEVYNGDNYTLNSIVNDVRVLLKENYSIFFHFNQKLISSGYFNNHENKYQETSYKIRKEQFYKVKEEFPRIEEKDLREGVGDIKYSIMISNIDSNYITDYKHVLNCLFLR